MRRIFTDILFISVVVPLLYPATALAAYKGRTETPDTLEEKLVFLLIIFLFLATPHFIGYMGMYIIELIGRISERNRKRRENS